MTFKTQPGKDTKKERGRVVSRKAAVSLLLILVAILAAACKPAVFDPPRRLLQEELQQESVTIPAAPFVSEAPTPTASPFDEAATAAETAASNPSITIWVNETSPAHSQALERMIAEFNQVHAIHVEAILVNPRLLPGLMQTAVLSDTLPDLVLHPVEYTMGWQAQGILNAAAATGIVDALGRETFSGSALSMISLDSQPGDDALVAAVPSDGWPQLIIYRADWFAANNLNPPASFNDLLKAASTLYNPDKLISGLVVPTESDLMSTQQVFEQLALANGCQLIDSKGEVTILHPACLGALDFYRELINDYSPIGVQTDTSALNAYLAGRTGIIISSPGVLPALAGLDETRPPACPDCATADFLAQNSGFLPTIAGNSDFATTAGFSGMTNLGITRAAHPEAAATFAQYWFNEGYLDWLGVNPERKVPLRLGTLDQPARFRDAWLELPLVAGGPNLRQSYGQDLVAQLASGAANQQRWGFAQGQGQLVTRLYAELTYSILLQEMLSGYFTSSQTVIEAYKRTTALIPDYAFLIDVEPTPTPGR